MWSHSAARRTRRLKLLKCINLASIIAMTSVRVLDFMESGDGRCAMCTTVRCPKARVAATPRFVALEACVPEGIVGMQICRWDVGYKVKDCISFFIESLYKLPEAHPYENSGSFSRPGEAVGWSSQWTLDVGLVTSCCVIFIWWTKRYQFTYSKWSPFQNTQKHLLPRLILLNSFTLTLF